MNGGGNGPPGCSHPAASSPYAQLVKRGVCDVRLFYRRGNRGTGLLAPRVRGAILTGRVYKAPTVCTGLPGSPPCSGGQSAGAQKVLSWGQGENWPARGTPGGQATPCPLSPLLWKWESLVLAKQHPRVSQQGRGQAWGTHLGDSRAAHMGRRGAVTASGRTRTQSCLRTGCALPAPGHPPRVLLGHPPPRRFPGARPKWEKRSWKVGRWTAGHLLP